MMIYAWGAAVRRTGVHGIRALTLDHFAQTPRRQLGERHAHTSLFLNEGI
jgi:hypothetical protein